VSVPPPTPEPPDRPGHPGHTGLGGFAGHEGAGPGRDPQAGPELSRLFDDLEQQAEGLALAERDLELQERRQAEYGAVTFEARLHASVGDRVAFAVTGAGTLIGTLDRVGQGWCLLDASASEAGAWWLVPLHAVATARGLSGRAISEAARSVVTRLGVGSALREVAATRARVLVLLRDGTAAAGVLGRIGADFVEVVDEAGAVSVVVWASVAAVRH
jgi:hypothetical protein